MSVRTSYRRTRIGWTGSCAAPQLDGSMTDSGSWSNFCCGSGLPPGVTAAQAAALVPPGVQAQCSYHGTAAVAFPTTSAAALATPALNAPASTPPAPTPYPILQPVGPIISSIGPIAPLAPTNVSPISASTTSPSTSSYLYTADEEAVQQLLYQYGDTWDNPQTIVMQMYAAGIPQGGVNQSNALPFLTGLSTSTTAATTTTSGLTSMISSIPTWGWIAAGVGALFLFRGKH